MADAEAFAVASKGRRRANSSKVRGRRLELRLNEEEFLFLESLSSAQGISKQAVMMRAVLTGGPEAAARVDRLREELRGARLLLANVANNVNQLARQANAFALGGEEPVSSDEVRRVADSVSSVVAKFEAIEGRAHGVQYSNEGDG